ncbi:MAG: hypothetical protein L3J22_08710 [Xanthomonadales bacterium]|nr:hypothetical protein [Xanthomonadales bacterium]
MSTTANAVPIAASSKQRIFIRYFTAILTDLVILGLFSQYWDRVEISSFTVALAAAVLLQVSLKATVFLEHKTAEYINKRSKKFTRLKRGLAAWAILFVSKLLILEALNIAFGDDMNFIGKWHGWYPLL